MVNTSRVVRLAAVVLLLSLSNGRSAQKPTEPVTRFRQVEAYSLYVKLKTDDDMKVEVGTEQSLRRKFKEEFVLRIDLNKRHLDIDLVEWEGEGVAEQILEQEDKEVYFAGNFVQESKSQAQGSSKTKAKLIIDELRQTFQVIVDTEPVTGTQSGYKKDYPKRTETNSGPSSQVTTGLRWLQTYPLPATGLALEVKDKPYPMEQCGTYLQDWDWLVSHKEHAHKGRLTMDLLPLGQVPKPPAPQPDQEIHADPGGPYSLQRGRTITLDGSRSVPSKGHRLQSYEWELTPKGTPDGCSGVGTTTTMSGARVTFLALCSLDVKLTVRDDGGKEDSGAAVVMVKGRSWKTKFTMEDKVKPESFTFVVNGFTFGYNRCARTGHFSESDNHWYESHRLDSSDNDYEDRTFWLDQVNDSGPFTGTFFVARGDFNIQRARWVNKKLYPPNGEVYELNPGPLRQTKSCGSGLIPAVNCSFGKPVIDRLARSVEEHEMLHSTLAEQSLSKDPATQIESTMTMDRANLRDLANGFLISAVTAMSNASTEPNVKARMSARFSPGGCIDFPSWESGVRGGCYFYFPSFIEK